MAADGVVEDFECEPPQPSAPASRASVTDAPASGRISPRPCPASLDRDGLRLLCDGARRGRECERHAHLELVVLLPGRLQQLLALLGGLQLDDDEPGGVPAD